MDGLASGFCSIGHRRAWARPRPEPDDGGRPPLPAGHPLTWGAIIADSVLAGEPYPYPVFLVPAGGPDIAGDGA